MLRTVITPRSQTPCQRACSTTPDIGLRIAISTSQNAFGYKRYRYDGMVRWERGFGRLGRGGGSIVIPSSQSSRSVDTGHGSLTEGGEAMTENYVDTRARSSSNRIWEETGRDVGVCTRPPGPLPCLLQLALSPGPPGSSVWSACLEEDNSVGLNMVH